MAKELALDLVLMLAAERERQYLRGIRIEIANPRVAESEVRASHPGDRLQAPCRFGEELGHEEPQREPV